MSDTNQIQVMDVGSIVNIMLTFMFVAILIRMITDGLSMDK